MDFLQEVTRFSVVHFYLQILFCDHMRERSKRSIKFRILFTAILSGAVGITIAGEEIFPAFNNLATLAPQKCEVDSCNQVIHMRVVTTHDRNGLFKYWLLSCRKY